MNISIRVDEKKEKEKKGGKIKRKKVKRKTRIQKCARSKYTNTTQKTNKETVKSGRGKTRQSQQINTAETD